MGTWAEGNFSSDGSLDYVAELIDQLTNTVVGCFKDDNADLDEGGESELMPSVAIIGVLSERCGAAPPKPEVIEDWRSKLSPERQVCRDFPGVHLVPISLN